MQKTWTVNLVFLLLELLPFVCYQFSCLLHKFKTAWHIFLKLHTNVKPWDNMQNTWTISLVILPAYEVCNGVYSFHLFSVCLSVNNFRVRSITLKQLNIFSWNFTQILNTMRRRTEHMNHNSSFPFFIVIALWILKMAISTIHSCPLYILRIIWDIFVKLHTNVNHNNRICRTQEP